jgi:3-oxoacyl-(acyl-carrier-protein) synthase
MGNVDRRRIYIKRATHISIQSPMSESWMREPRLTSESYVRSEDPQFREWLNPMESRRLSNILKRALVTAIKVKRDSGIEQPEAVITGTGLGCIENTELFLNQLCREGEELLKPTYFMQSTHNTVSSLIGINGKIHGYNSTYSHKGVSFDSALMDAIVQMRLGDINNALVTGNDEITPTYFSILKRSGYVGQEGQVPAGEASVAMMLTTDAEDTLCEIEDFKMVYRKENIGEDTLNTAGPVDAILMGLSGERSNDEAYRDIEGKLPKAPILRYKHLFGESYTASGLGVYAAAQMLKEGTVPAVMRVDGGEPIEGVRRIFVVNHSDGREYTFLTMRRAE